MIGYEFRFWAEVRFDNGYDRAPLFGIELNVQAGCKPAEVFVAGASGFPPEADPPLAGKALPRILAAILPVIKLF